MCRNLSNVVFMVGSNTLNQGKMYKIADWISYNKWASDNQVELEYDDNDISAITVINIGF
jgi:hypothetical protein